MKPKAVLTALLLALGFLAGRALPAQENSLLIPISLQVEQVEPFLSAGETIKGFRVPGEPIGLSWANLSKGRADLLVSHGLENGRVTVYETRSFWDAQGVTVIAGRGGKAVSRLYDVRKGRYNASRGGLGPLGELCAAGDQQGFERRVILAGERKPAKGTGPGTGERSLAIVGKRAYILPRLGRFAKGDHLVLSGAGTETAVLCLEAGGEKPESRIYLYVGTKEGKGSDLERDGLTNGSLFALAVDGKATEETLRDKGKRYHFKALPVDWRLSAEGLAKEAGGKGATGFIRLGGCAHDPGDPRVVYVTSIGSDARAPGGAYVNHNGRLYRLTFDEAARPEKGGVLEVLLAGTEGVVSPSCVAVNGKGRVTLGEAPTFPLPGRDSSVWSFRPATGVLTRLLETNSKGGLERGAWAVGGLEDASGVLGAGWWLVSVRPRGGPVSGGLPPGQVATFHTQGGS